jgi:stearoyl-CoA desaturase (delta-9 desaturase)
VPPAFTALACWLIDGKTGLFWGFCVSTVILYHTTFAINSFCHLLGRQRYLTGESSKNSLILALLTLGEGWHNNHHYYPHSARQGFYWWEIDLTYYALRALALTGLVRDIHEPSRKVIDSNHLGAEGVAQAP